MRLIPFFYLCLVASSVCLSQTLQQSKIAEPSRVEAMQIAGDSPRTTLRENVHPLARAEFDRGEVPSDSQLNRMIMVLKRRPEQEVALNRLLESQQDVQSADYHKWLSPQQFGERFGPSADDLGAVTQWLTANGFKIAQVSKSELFIEFSGTAGDVKHAFGTPIHRFDVQGEQHWANVADPTIPSNLSAVIAGIDSLHNFQKQSQHISLGPYSVSQKGLLRDSPSFTENGGPGVGNEYAVTPYDFAAIYDLLPLWNATPTAINGTGQIIAIVGRSDISPIDAPAFWSSFGLDGVHAPEPKLVITYNGPNPGINADEAEADIDTQWSGAVAPGATISFVTSASTTTTDGVDLSALYIVDNNLAPVLSESYGQCEKGLGSGGVQFYGSLWQQAAAQGISVFVSSGDSGAAGCDSPGAPATSGLQVNGIASTPYNAAVGGTDFNQYQTWPTYWNATNAPVTQQSAKGYIPETSWNDSCTNAVLQQFNGGSSSALANCNNAAFASLLDSAGGSGGNSSSWLKPDWQTGTPADNARDLPDVSLFAGNGFMSSFYFICDSGLDFGDCEGNYSGFGGTSVSSPQFAGIMALINQKTGSPQGIPGAVLYKLAAKYPTAFHDTPAGSTIAMPCVTGSPDCGSGSSSNAYGILSGYPTATGYDLATGLGSVDIANLVNQWQSVSFTPSTTTLSLNGGAAVNITHGTAIPVSISVSPGAATGEVALMVAPGTPGDAGIAAFPLASGAATASTSLLPGGSYSVIAHYSGDSTYGGSYSSSVPVTVSAEPSVTMPNLLTTDVNHAVTSFSATGATYGDGYQVLRVDVGDSNAVVSSTSGIASKCANSKESCPTGKVTLSAPGTPLDGVTLALNSKGFAEVAVPTGTYRVSVTYGGDASFGPSTGTTGFSIAKAATKVFASAGGYPVPYGTSSEISATVNTTSNGVAPGGTFQFFVDGSELSLPYPSALEGFPYEGVANGTTEYATLSASDSATFLSAGAHTLSTQYSGDANYAGGTSSPATISVTQAFPYFTNFGVTYSGASLAVGQSTTANATLVGASNGAAPTGVIAFYDNSVAIPGTITYSTEYSTLTASLTFSFATPGVHVITAGYPGDANYYAVTTDTGKSLTVVGPISVTLAGNITIANPGQSGSTTLSVTPNGGFAGTATLSCTPDPSAHEASCSLTSGSTSGTTIQVNLTGSGVKVTLNVATTAPQSAANNRPQFGPMPELALAMLAFVPLLRRHRKFFLCFIALVFTLSLGACGGGGSTGSGGGGGGGGSSDPGTNPGTYFFTVTTSTGTGASVISGSTSVQVMVN